jgi:hypothetical protein
MTPDEYEVLIEAQNVGGGAPPAVIYGYQSGHVLPIVATGAGARSVNEKAEIDPNATEIDITIGRVSGTEAIFEVRGLADVVICPVTKDYQAQCTLRGP